MEWENETLNVDNYNLELANEVGAILAPQAPKNFHITGEKVKGTNFKENSTVIFSWETPDNLEQGRAVEYILMNSAGQQIVSGTSWQQNSLKIDGKYYVYCRYKEFPDMTPNKAEIELFISEEFSKPEIKNIGKSNSIPGYIGEKDEEINISWKAIDSVKNNTVTNYEILYKDSKSSGDFIVFANSEIKKENNTAKINIESLNLDSTLEYLIKLRIYDSFNDFIDSETQSFYIVSPKFLHGPIIDNKVTEGNILINWSNLTFDNPGVDKLEIKYSLSYKIITQNNNNSYIELQNNLSSLSYVWDLPDTIEKNSLISLQIKGTVYSKNGNEIISVFKESEEKDRFFFGTLPSQLSSITFKIPEGYYFSPPGSNDSPLKYTYNVIENSWKDEGGYNFTNFLNNLQINCLLENLSDIFVNGIKVEWQKGNYKGEKIITREKKGEEESLDKMILICEFSKEDSPQLFSKDKNFISFQIYSIYETALNSGVYIYEKTPSLTYEASNNKLTIAELPQIYKSSTIPSLNSNMIRNVDFLNKIIKGGLEDYKLTDFRANTAISGTAPVIGFKAYAALDREKIANGFMIEVDKEYFTQGAEILESKDNINFITNNLLKPDGELDEGNIVSFNPNILDDPEFLRDLLNNGRSLEELSSTQKFYYVITAIDALKQESKENYILEVNYDFRLEAELITQPIMDDYIDENGETIFNIANDGIMYFHGQNNKVYDWITFTWYPAFNINHYLKNKDKYYYDEKNKVGYLLFDDSDINNYILYKWKEGVDEPLNLELVKGIDYQVLSELKIINGEEKEIVKYQAKYAMNLKDLNNTDIFYLTLVPYYIDDSNIIKTSVVSKEKNIIQFNNINQKFCVNRFIAPIVRYGNIDRAQGNNFKIDINIEDWGGKEENPYIVNSKTELEIINNFFEDGLKIIKNEVYGKSTLEFDFSDYKDILDSMSFSATTTMTITVDYYKLSGFKIQKDIRNLISTYKYYIPANFSTLSLRKNKVGINKSDLTNTEEALYVVAKNRLDSENSENENYPHVLSIQSDLYSKMPNFNLNGLRVDKSFETGTYIGFYYVDDDNKPYRMGSIGMENGYPCFVYKGKFFEDDTKKKNDKDYFEKTSLRDLLAASASITNYSISGNTMPIGSIVMFPKKRLEGSSNEANSILHDTYGYKTWYICDGETELNKENNTVLIELLGLEGINYKIPKIETPDPENYIYIIKGDE